MSIETEKFIIREIHFNFIITMMAIVWMGFMLVSLGNQLDRIEKKVDEISVPKEPTDTSLKVRRV